MDNFLQILFFLFIIFSILSPLFKKKPEENKKRQAPPKTPDRRNEPVTRSEQALKKDDEEYDIMKEIEGLFDKPGMNDYYKSKAEEREIYQEEDYKPEEKIVREKTDWNEEINGKTKEDDEWHRPTTEADYKKEDKQLAAEAKKFEEFLNRDKKKTDNKVKEGILQTIRKPKVLREYILISEILGKPKALRR